MKKSVLVLLSILSLLSAEAQYRKFPLDTNHYWQEKYLHVGNIPSDYMNCSYVYRVKKDSIIGGITYKYCTTENVECNLGKFLYNAVLLREDTIRKLLLAKTSVGESIIFNFNKSLNDTVLMPYLGQLQTYTVTQIDSVQLGDGFFHKRFFYSPNVWNDFAMEGMGGKGGLLSVWTIEFETSYRLLCHGQITPSLSIYSSEGSGAVCPNTTGIKSEDKQAKLLPLYPNPTSNNFTISGTGSALQSLEIRTGVGALVFQEYYSNIFSKAIDITDFESGIYYVQVKTEDQVQNFKIIKE